MEYVINRIYELLYTSIITPYNLLDNAKLENYTYVKYYKDNELFVTEMECMCEDGKIRKFFYHFDNEDALQYVTEEFLNTKEILFDRKKELREKINEYKILRQQHIS